LIDSTLLMRNSRRKLEGFGRLNRVRPVTKPKTRSSYHLSTFLIVGEVTMGEGLK